MIHIGGVVLYCWEGGGRGRGGEKQRAPVSTSKQSIFCVLSACNVTCHVHWLHRGETVV